MVSQANTECERSPEFRRSMKLLDDMWLNPLIIYMNKAVGRRASVIIRAGALRSKAQRSHDRQSLAQFAKQNLCK